MMVPIVVSVLSLCVSVASFLFCRWYIKRKTAAAQLLADYRDEVGRLIAEIDKATDRDSLLVEERIKVLRKMLEDTDKRISVYIREARRSRDGEAMYASLGRGIRAALDSRLPQPEQPSLFPSEAGFVQEAVRMAPPQYEIAPPLDKTRGGKSGYAQPPEETDEQDKFAKSRLKMQIAEMAAQGVPSHEIASKFGISNAEVDLALNLLDRSVG